MVRNVKVSKVSASKVSASKGKTVTATNDAIKPASLSANVRAEENGTLVAYANSGASPYSGLKGAARGAYTTAALIVSRFIQIEGDSAKHNPNGSIALFNLIVGKGVKAHHADKFDANKLNAKGFAYFASARVDGTAPAYGTDQETVLAFVDAMQNSRTDVPVGDGTTVSITRKVTAAIARKEVTK